MNVRVLRRERDLKMAYDNSFYFIAGCGEPISEWVEGYEKFLEEDGIGKPVRWYRTTGAAVNLFAGPALECRDYFQEDLTILMFPLNGLDAGKLALFKLRMQDRWFDDVIQNMRGH